MSSLGISSNPNKIVRFIAIFIFLTSVSAVFLYFLNWETVIPASWRTGAGSRNTFSDFLNVGIFTIFIPLLSGIIGSIIISNRPKNPIGWQVLTISLGYGIMALTKELTVYLYFTVPTPGFFRNAVALTLNGLWIFPISILPLSIALFPNGRFLSRRWGVIHKLSTAFFILFMAGASLIEIPLTKAYQVPNPLTLVSDEQTYQILQSLGLICLMSMFLLTLISLFIRYKHADTVTKQQIKWLLGSVGLLVVISVVVMPYAFLTDYAEIAQLILASTFPLPFAGIGAAIVRYKLYDIDIIIRKTLQYALVTGLLVLAYFVSVIFLQSLIETLSGEQSPLVIVFSTLAIAGLFNPLRLRVQNFIDRRFYRKKYDAEQALAHFAVTVRDEVDMDKLTGALLAVVVETVHPEQASLWLKSMR